MQFKEALKIIQEHSSADLPPCGVLLVTGFNPLHVQTFLQAHLQRLLPTRKIAVSTGLYDDLFGTLARINSSGAELCAIALEWPELDGRLGFRRLGGWGFREVADIVVGAESRLLAIRKSLEAAPIHVALAVSLPNLALPPLFYTPSWQLGEAEMRLRHAVDEFALWAAGRPNLRLLNVYCPQILGPAAPALDLKGELLAGLSYTPSYAERLAHALARLLVPPLPKRGLITDLDDTLWAGIAGEIGPDAVSWDLEHKSQLHGLYQQSLRALAEQGVLIAAVSKNDPEIVEAVFRRSDLLLPRKCVFPVEAHWKAKSDSVTRILRAWNLHPDSVVFVDDGPSEIAEVKAAHPDMECIRFDPRDYTAVHTLLYRLRDLFAKQAITEEDGVRRESLRAAAVFREAALQPSFSEENFLRDAEAKITFDFSSATFQPRSLELVNKTNQFNLNGTRYTEGEWHTRLVTPGTFLVTTNYRDKYGPLGIISVLMGKADETGLTIKTWVMSCRAFGRRIEYQCLRIILDRYRVPEILLEFSPTSRNHYLQEFLESISGQKHDGSFRISRDRFLDQCPRLYHQVDIHDE